MNLSVSRIRMYLRCPRQYEFSYVQGIKIPPSGVLVRGSSFHEALRHNWGTKLVTGEDAPITDLTDIYSDQFANRIKEARLREDEKPGALKDSGIKMVEVYRQERAPQITPVLFEQKVELTLDGGDLFVGVIDLLDSDNYIRDFKTSSKSPNENEVHKDSQLTAYGWCYYNYTAAEFQEPKLPAGYALEYAVHNHAAKTDKAKPRVVPVPTSRTADDINAFAEDIAAVAIGIKAGAFPRNQTGWHCSPDWCGYWDRCMKRRQVA
jgi:RecB family exonuclease